MKPSLKRLGWVVAICALAGALAGIAGSAAAPSKKSSKSAQAQKRARVLRFHMQGGPPGRPFFGPGGPAVHSEMVVPNANGDGFDTITTDSGKLKAIDGSKLTVTEGTDKATYGEPTIDVGSSPIVIRNHEKAALSDLKTGDFVHIIQGTPKGTIVMAESPDFRAQEEKERRHFGKHFFGPPPPGGPGEYPGSEKGSSSSGGSNS